jgi:Nucleotidyl transferase AbiEii toxin, Type IV TA system
VTAKNLPASVQARLQKSARTSKRPFHELLQYYAMERFLYRLSTTPHGARFVLKGALMLHVWEAPLARATKDIDFLGRLDNSLDNLERVVREVCVADVEPDGMVFEPATVKVERIKEDADYEGVRVRFVGLLGKARAAIQIDVGFGDVITPGAETITYPTLLDFPCCCLPSSGARCAGGGRSPPSLCSRGAPLRARAVGPQRGGAPRCAHHAHLDPPAPIHRP